MKYLKFKTKEEADKAAKQIRDNILEAQTQEALEELKYYINLEQEIAIGSLLCNEIYKKAKSLVDAIEEQKEEKKHNVTYNKQGDITTKGISSKFNESSSEPSKKDCCYVCQRSVTDKVKTGCEEIDGKKYCRHCKPSMYTNEETCTQKYNNLYTSEEHVKKTEKSLHKKSIWKPLRELGGNILSRSIYGRDSDKVEICGALLELEERITKLENKHD